MMDEPREEGSGAGGILQTFWGLSSLKKSEQLQSAKQLITSLRKSQDECGEEMCSDLQYTLKRLVRGLASNRKGARQGYFISLTELLSLFPNVAAAQVFELIKDHLEPTGSDKAAEERGMYFGKLFALLALMKSGRVTNEEDVVNVAEQLHVCSEKKSYLREFCYVSFAQLVDFCHAHNNDDVIRSRVIPLTLDTGWDECTPEQLFLYLHLSSLYGKEKWFRKYLNRKLGSKCVVSGTNIDSLCGVLIQSTSSHPHLHSTWEPVLREVRKEGIFQLFWKTVVDESLFSSSHERRYLGFKLLETLLPTLTMTELPTALSPGLLSCLLNNSGAKDNYLHAAAKHLLSQLSGFVECSTDTELLITLYLHLQRSTNNKFDQLSGVKLSEQLLSRLSVNGLEWLLDKLTTLLCDPSDIIIDTINGESVDTHSTQLWALDQILLLLRQHKVPRQSSWILKAAKIILLFSLFKVPSSSEKSLPQELVCCTPKAPFSASIQLTLTERLASALSDLSSMAVTKTPPSCSTSQDASKDQSAEKTDTHQRSGKRWSMGLPGVMEDGSYFLTALVKHVDKLLSGGLSFVDDLTDEVSEAWTTAFQYIVSLTSKESLPSEEKAFLLLFSALALQLLSAVEEQGTAAKTIKEVSICFGEMQESLSKKRTPRRGTSGSDWITVLTDILLGLLSQSSQLWRNVVEQVFKQLTHCVTEDSLKLILDVLEPKQSKDDIMEEDSEHSNSGEASEGSEAEGSSNESEGGDVGDSGDESEHGDGGIDPIFRSEVRKALGAAAIDSDAESEKSLDDDAMIAVDSALAEVFRTRFALKHQKRVRQDEERSVIHFKLRVLVLVEVFVRKEATNPLVLDVVVPLYEMVQGSQSRKDHTPLVEKARSIFINRLCHMKVYPKANISVQRCHNYLHKLLGHLGKANILTAPLLTQGFLLLIRVLRGNSTNVPALISPLTTRSGRKRKLVEPEPHSDKEHGDLRVEEITSWLAEALRSFVTTKNTNINPFIFTTYIERYPSLGIHLIPSLVELLPLSANHFRKTQVHEMLGVLRAHIHDKSLFDRLADEDLEAIDTLANKSKRRKRSKQNS